MSIRHMTDVWEDTSIESAGDVLIMLAIADYANHKGMCWPSIPVLAKKARMSERSVQLVIKKFISIGKLRMVFGAGPRGANLYQIVNPNEIDCGAMNSPGNFCPGENEMGEGVKSTATRIIEEPSLNQESAKALVADKKKSKASQEIIDHAIQHKKFVSLWRAAFLQYKKVEYTVSRQEWKAVETLIGTGRGLQGLIDMAVDAWTNPEFGWFCSNLKSLWHFAKKFNEIAVELKERKNASQRSTKSRTDGNQGTANDGLANEFADIGKVV